MNFTLIRQLAWRYMRGKRAGNAVPILSRISMSAIAVGSCAMIVLFSVFNGFEGLVKDLYKAFYPDIKVMPAKGKFFSLDEQQLQKVRSLEGITAVSTVLEDNVLANSNNEQQVATIKGIDDNYFAVNNVAPYVIEGSDSVSSYPYPTAMVGLQIANTMGLDIYNDFSQLLLYYPNAEVTNPALNIQSAFQRLQLKPAGVFQIQDEFDSKYVLAPLEYVQGLLKAEGQYSSLEIKLADGASESDMKESLQQLLGSDYTVATRYEQNRTMYMVMKSEKWAVWALLLLVLVIASFNMVGALSLLILEKQKDMAILKAMGAQSATIKGIFVAEGLLWAITGGGIGLLIGAAICLGQQHFKWIKLQGSFIIDAYPVLVKPADFLLIIPTILLVGLLASWIPAMRAARAADPTLKSA